MAESRSSEPMVPGVGAFEAFLRSDPSTSCFSKPLLIASNRSEPDPRRKLRFAVVVDAEHCLDRLYGGYYSDWSCGGQWCNTYAFLSRLFSLLGSQYVHLTLFFDGTRDKHRREQWLEQQRRHRANVDHVMRYVQRKATPPPKAWWVPPTALTTVLRMALKCLNVAVLASTNDHKLEVMHFFWENGFHALAADDGGEYAMFGPFRLLSAHELKMSFQLEVTTRETDLDKVARVLDINPNRFCLLATLLGNHIIPAALLTEFHYKLAPDYEKDKTQFPKVIKAVVKYIRSLSKVDDYVTLARDLFGLDEVNEIARDGRMVKLVKSIDYFRSGCQDGHVVRRKFRPERKLEMWGSQQNKEADQTRMVENIALNLEDTVLSDNDSGSDSEESKGTDEEEKNGKLELDLVAEETNGKGSDHLDNRVNDNGAGFDGCSHKSKSITTEDRNQSDESDRKSFNEILPSKMNEAFSSATNGGGVMSVVQALAKGIDVEPAEDGRYPSQETVTLRKQQPRVKKPKPMLPHVHPDVLSKAKERHRQAQMSPLVLHLLTKGEIWFPVILEDYNGQMPPVHKLMQGMRQRIYAVLFNLHHFKFNKRKAQETVKTLRRNCDDLRCKAKKMSSSDFVELEKKKELLAKADALFKQSSEMNVPEVPKITILERMPYDDYSIPDEVEPVDLGWGVPTVQRLWFGGSLEDKQFRLRAFLSCLMCDSNSALLLSSANVPQHLLIVACVLRYLMCTTGLSLLKKFELDTFMVVALSENELSDAHYLSEIKLVDEVTKRGIQLAAIFMNAIDMALLANDVCGMPLPVYMCLPWRFFDGKLFHRTLLRAQKATNLLDLCQGNMHLLHGVERMRAAVLHGLMPSANTAFPGSGSWGQYGGQIPHYGAPYERRAHKGGKGKMGTKENSGVK